ncbi:MAG: hypothetical protein LBH25_09175 [Fibromonadaceae bacterium]|jgi:hypothetical protein|nr:hypothetical protein [Fibromonadaceae bacterium]
MAIEYVINAKDDASLAISNIDKNLNILNQSFTSINKETNIFNESMGALGTIAASLASELAILALYALKDLGKEMMNSYASAGKLSESVGVAAKDIIGLRYAADLSKVGTEEMDKSLISLNKTIADVVAGNNDAANSFEKIGISVQNVDGTVKNTEQVLMEMADAFKEMPDGIEKTSLAIRIFGENGMSMVNMLKDGSTSLREMIYEGSIAAGNVEDIAKAMTALDEAGTRAKTVIMGMMATIADTSIFQSAIGFLGDLSKEWMNFSKEIGIAAEQKKTLASMNTQIMQAELKTVEMKRAELVQSDKYQKASYSDKENMLRATEKELNKLREKLGLNQEEIRYMMLKANAFALEKKAKDGTLNDVEQRKLESFKSEIEQINVKNELLKESTRIEMENVEKENSVVVETIARHKAKQKAIEEASNARKRAEEESAREAKKIAEQEAKEFEDNMKKKEEAMKSLADLDNRLRINALEGEEKKIAEIELNYEKQFTELERLHEAELMYAESDEELALAQFDRRMELERQFGEAKDAIRQEYADKEAKRIEDEGAAKDALNKKLLADERALRDAKLSAVGDSFAAMQQITAGQKSYSTLYKASAIGEAAVNATQSVLRTMASVPYPFNIPLAALQSAAAAVQVQKIASTKMYRGGMIPGINTLVMANEQGREAILNPMAVRAIGGEVGVNALNSGHTYNANSYDNRQSNSNTIVINTTLLSQKTLRDDVQPALRWQQRRQ